MKHIYFLLTLSLIYSCNSQEKTNYFELTAIEELRDFNDTIFFGSIMDIEYDSNNYFLLDQSSNSIIITDRKYQFQNRIVRTGESPKETISTYNIGISDNKIALQDLAGGKFLFLDENDTYINSFKVLFDASEFIYEDNEIIGQYKGEVTLPFGKLNERGDSLARFGLPIKAEEGFPRKHLVSFQDKILAVYMTNFPYIEIYDRSGNHLKTSNLSSIPLFSDWLKSANVEEKIRTSTPNLKRSQVVFVDACTFNDKLYLSTAGIPYIDKKIRGMIIELSLDQNFEFQVERQLILEENIILTAFVVTEEEYLTGFEPLNGTVRKYKIH